MTNPTTDLAELERRLWAAADELRANSTLTAAQYRDPVLGLIFLAFAEHRYDAIRPEVEATATARRTVGADDFRASGRRVRAREREALVARRAPGVGGRRPQRRRGDGLDRGDQPRPEGRAAARLREAREVDARRAAPPLRAAAAHAVGRRVRADLRVLPRQVRGQRGPARRRVLHAEVDRAADRRDHRAVPRPDRRPGVRVGRHVRAVRALRRAPPARRPRTCRSTGRRRRRRPSRSADEPRAPRPLGRHPPGEQLLRGLRTTRSAASTS